MSEINSQASTPDNDPYKREEPPLVVVISGPSGVGKDATLKKMKEMGYPFHFVVTATTRPKREGETDGVDYYFVGMGDFAQLIEKGAVTRGYLGLQVAGALSPQPPGAASRQWSRWVMPGFLRGRPSLGLWPRPARLRLA